MTDDEIRAALDAVLDDCPVDALVTKRHVAEFVEWLPGALAARGLRIERVTPTLRFDPCPECGGEITGSEPIIVPGREHRVMPQIVVTEWDIVTGHVLLPCRHEIEGGFWYAAPEYVIHYGEPPEALTS